MGEGDREAVEGARFCTERQQGGAGVNLLRATPSHAPSTASRSPSPARGGGFQSYSPSPSSRASPGSITGTPSRMG